MTNSTLANSTTAGEKVSRRRRRSSFTKKDRVVLFGLVGIPTALCFALVVIPAILTILLSFTFWDGIGGLKTIHWAGFQNYRQIFTLYEAFPKALRNNALWLVFFALIPTPAGIILAYFVDKKLKGTNFYQTAFYLPMVLSLAVTGIVWDYIFRTNGLVNSLLGNTSAESAISWFGDPHKNIWVVLGIASWRHVGYIMMLYLAGMKAVDPALHEASAIDGASDWYTFRKVIFPSLSAVNVIIVVVTVIDSLRAFDLVYIINRGRNGLELLGVLVYENIFGESSRIGWGAALATMLFMLSIIPIMIYLYQTFKKDK